MSSLLDDLPPIGSISPAEEKLLLDKPTEDDLNTLVLGHMTEGYAYARGCGAHLPDDELFSVVYRALMQAAVAFKPSVGACRFFGYSKPFLRGHVNRERKAKDVVRNAEGQESLDAAADVADSEPIEHSFMPDTGALDWKERWKIIGPVLAGALTDYDLMLLNLRYRAGFSAAEIGERLGVSRQAIERTHTQALKKARAALLTKGVLFDL